MHELKREILLKLKRKDNEIIINEVTVNKSFAVSGASKLEELENAQVAVFKNDAFVENLTYSKTLEDAVGKFSTNFIPEPISDYRIEVSHPDFEKVKSNTAISEGINITNPTAKFVGGNSFNSSFTFDDPAAVNYYYMKKCGSGKLKNCVHQRAGEYIFPRSLMKLVILYFVFPSNNSPLLFVF